MATCSNHASNGVTLDAHIDRSISIGDAISACAPERRARGDIMSDFDASRTFRGLPLTPEQDAEIRHYIKRKKQRSEDWDTPELDDMLRDMLEPPGDDEDAPADEDSGEETRAVAERASAFIDEGMDPIENSEEWHAAMEAEAMKGPRR
jgi:hypothetical protein